MRRFTILCAVCLLSLSVFAGAQSKTASLNASLAGVTERGRALYAYDQAAWHATDAFFAMHPDTTGLTNYICTRTTAGWTVFYPTWDETHTRLLVAYDARQSGAAGQFVVHKHDPPWEAPDVLAPMERALELASASFPRPDRPYNSAILPAPGGNYYVYLYPAQIKDTVWPLGGDVRFTISADGRQILEKRLLHKTILDMEFDPQKHAVAGYHVHVLSDVPEDTDVLYVLSRKPSIPEYIRAGKKIFIVNVDGSLSVEKK